jgi:diphosphoinositol-polyphosphate diphosphatase
VFVMQVTEEMDVWPEQDTRSRTWCHPSLAIAHCRHEWMQDALRQWATRFQPEVELEDDGGGGGGDGG